MAKLIFITGGARSGKSSFALEIAKSIERDKLFLATCIPQDEEMKRRVRLHKQERPSSWRTIEANKGLASVLRKEVESDIVIILDCLTLFVSAMLVEGKEEEKIKSEVREIVRIIKKGKSTVIIVTNEVGLGLVPDNKLSRDFRDIAGFCNQIVASGSDEAYFMISAIPLQIKGGTN
ncbi:MAG: bifunctional adenosylcobinamide kinase/adenosylcobinamide-phosphate guanylyltransferase [Spirochaetota bacterium]|nr:bifunctional adenosylcobinamide kinase/adenosylcobinamide-phosphate guanylyltransferase [Spirochaetota bacterium]